MSNFDVDISITRRIADEAESVAIGTLDDIARQQSTYDYRYYFFKTKKRTKNEWRDLRMRRRQQFANLHTLTTLVSTDESINDYFEILSKFLSFFTASESLLRFRRRCVDRLRSDVDVVRIYIDSETNETYNCELTFILHVCFAI